MTKVCDLGYGSITQGFSKVGSRDPRGFLEGIPGGLQRNEKYLNFALFFTH